MAKKKYSKEFNMEHNREWCGNLRLRHLNHRLAIFMRHNLLTDAMKISAKLIRNRKHRVRITIEFLKEL